MHAEPDMIMTVLTQLNLITQSDTRLVWLQAMKQCTDPRSLHACALQHGPLASQTTAISATHPLRLSKH